MKNIILTALDDNDDIWFTCFIPFILTLQNTNYKGDIGVISYSLSDEKRNILDQNKIKVFNASHTCTELSLDRFISIAAIANNYDIIALYDADIWFPKHELTLFEQINDFESLHCCYDVIIPPFLLNCVIHKESVKAKLDSLLSTQTHYWQAGLTIAHRNAWLSYRKYIINALNSRNYHYQYGIDTTLLNLYSVDTNKVVHLHKKYNCLPFWGIQVDKYNFFPIKVDNEEIEGIHITRYHRDTSNFSFIKVGIDLYLKNGSPFALKMAPLYHYQNCGNLFQNTYDKNDNPFYCNEVFCHTLLCKRTHNQLLEIDTIGTFEIKLTYAGSNSCQIGIGYQALLNRVLPIKFKIYLRGQEINIAKDRLTILTIYEGDELLIQSLHLRSDFGIKLLLSRINIT